MSSFATGDIQNNVEKLRRLLKSISYCGQVNTIGIVSGSPETLLPLIDYCLMGFSRNVAKFIVSKEYRFYTDQDYDFLKGVFQFLQKELKCFPDLTVSQFFSNGFVEKKVILVCKIILAVKKLHNEVVIKKRKKKYDTKRTVQGVYENCGTGQGEFKKRKTKTKKGKGVVKKHKQAKYVPKLQKEEDVLEVFESSLPDEEEKSFETARGNDGMLIALKKLMEDGLEKIRLDLSNKIDSLSRSMDTRISALEGKVGFIEQVVLSKNDKPVKETKVPEDRNKGVDYFVDKYRKRNEETKKVVLDTN